MVQPLSPILCPGSGLPTDAVEDLAGNVRWCMCVICGAVMTDMSLAIAHESQMI